MVLTKDTLAHYSIDTKTSLLTVQVFAAGLASVIAHSPSFAVRDLVGEMEFAAGTMTSASLKMTMTLRSLDLLDEVTKADRREIERVMFEEVLEASKYPQAWYESKHIATSEGRDGICRAKIAGDLTLHGTTRGVSVESQLVVADDSIRAQGSFSFLQPDFGLKIASIAGGTMKLREEVKCHYFIVGERHG